MLEYAYLIPVPPIIAFILNILFGKRFKEGGAYISIFTSSIAFLISMAVLFEALAGGHLDKSWVLSELGEKIFEVGILIDPLSALMLFIVSFVSLLVLIYSLGYMHDDPSKPRYYAEISLFSASMLGLVIANNILQMFVFWELVGLCSYLLIGFWYHKPSAAAAAKKAFLVTRIGDVMMLFGIIWLYGRYETFHFQTIFENVARDGALSVGTLKLILLLLFGGAVGKSAQFPLHVWLPDAMEGPTTVSCLIHSATMVKAGIYLVARIFPIYEHSPEAMLFVAYIGGFTALLAGTMAMVMTDIKRVLAYSTISHLGFMSLALGVGGYSAGMFHLLNHSFFKALLFLAAGSIIHGTGTQDIREMGGIWRKMRITAVTSLIGAWALSGIPPLSGFWSKDEILSSVFATQDYLLFGISMAAAFCSAFYAARWFLMIFGPTKRKIHAHESPKVMTYPLILLSIGAIFSGFFGKQFGHWILETLPEAVEELYEGYFVMVLSVSIAFSAAIFAFLMYHKKMISRERFSQGVLGKIQKVVERKYFLDDLFNGFAEFVAQKVVGALNWFDIYIVDGAVNGLGRLGIFLSFKVIDRFDIRAVDGAVNGIAQACLSAGSRLRRIQTGHVQDYASALILGIIVLLLLIKGLGG